MSRYSNTQWTFITSFASTEPRNSLNALYWINKIGKSIKLEIGKCFCFQTDSLNPSVQTRLRFVLDDGNMCDQNLAALPHFNLSTTQLRWTTLDQVAYNDTTISFFSSPTSITVCASLQIGVGNGIGKAQHDYNKKIVIVSNMAINILRCSPWNI